MRKKSHISLARYMVEALDNEELHLITKLMRAGLGLTYIEHQARI